MEYLLLIYHTENAFANAGPTDREAMYKEYNELIQELSANGKFIGGHELMATATAATVRIRDGKKAITDGPFAETKEQLGGYFLVNVKDHDEALAIAARIPGARYGAIEARPVVVRQQAKPA